MSNLALMLRNLTRTLLVEYDQREGVSGDHYWPTPQWHAMAEGKFLTALAEARKLKLISGPHYNLMLKRSYARLRAGNLAAAADHACWGLGFPYKATDAREPFVITTAVVARGLLDQHEFVDAKLLRQGLLWLTAYPHMMSAKFGARRVRVPAFAPNVPLIVINAVSYWAGVLTQAGSRVSVAGRRHADKAARWVLHRRVSPVGWPYTQQSSRLDLLHQCYIIEGLAMWAAASGAAREVQRLEDWALRTISGFQFPHQWIDKVDVVPQEAAITACGKSSKYSMAPVTDDLWVLRHHVEARPWSYGELLVVMSRFAEVGLQANHWRVMARRLGFVLSQRMSSQSAGAAAAMHAGFARELMHIAHGLVRLLAVIRAQPAEKEAT